MSLDSSPPIEDMVASGEILRDALLLAGSLVVPGKTTIDINREVHRFILDSGGIPAFLGYEGFPAACCMSVNEEVVHCTPSDRKLEEGDIISIDCGVIKNKAYTDAARTFPVGSIGHREKKLLDITRKALAAGIEKALAGNLVGAISNKIQEVAELGGYSVSREFVGHGIGYELHMLPDVPNFGSRRIGPRLVVGEYIAIEPVVFDGSWETAAVGDWRVVSKTGALSAHFENTVFISESGPVILTE